MSDRASKALAEASLPGEPRTYDATSKRSGVPLSTLSFRAIGSGYAIQLVKNNRRCYSVHRF